MLKLILILTFSMSVGAMPNPQHLNEFPKELSSWGITIKGPSKDHEVYKLNTPLFTDYSKKLRSFSIPKGKQIKWEGNFLVFPIGSVLSKTFFYEDNIETRIFYYSKLGWLGASYKWEGSEAYISKEEVEIPMSHKGVGFTYKIPSQKQCLNCHYNGPIGPKRADNLAELALWMEKGILEKRELGNFQKLPVWNSPHSKIQDRARAYLEVNCAHCHNPEGRAAMTGLFYGFDRKSLKEKGFCKESYSSMENEYVIHPGDPTKSELISKLKTRDILFMMPEIGRDLVHQEGVELMENYIKTFSFSCD